jgi:hypothetical protein
MKNRYLLSFILEILDRITKAQFFTKIDVKNTYHYIRIKKDDKWKTAFRIRYNHFEYLVIPFGLTNTPTTFQSYIHRALHRLLDIFCIIYLNDILIFSKTRQEHTEYIQQVLQRLGETKLYTNPKKCLFYQLQIEFLGFILLVDRISIDLRRIDTIVS